MPPSTSPVLVVYDTPGSARLLSRPVNWSAVGTLAPGGVSCGWGYLPLAGDGAPTATGCTWGIAGVTDAIEVTPAAAAPMAAAAATPVAMDFTVVFTVRSSPWIRMECQRPVTNCHKCRRRSHTHVAIVHSVTDVSYLRSVTFQSTDQL